MTPTAPSLVARINSALASSAYCQGNDANQRMRSGLARCCSAMESLTSRAALMLISRSPQYTFGQVSDTTAISTPALFMFSMRIL